MLVIPMDRPIDWHRPPLVTFLLFIVNVLIFVTVQSDDGLHAYQAFRYYYESGLHRIELPRYREHLLETGEGAFARRWGGRIEDPSAPWLNRLLADGPFQQALLAGRVITPQDPQYEQWRRKREAFQAELHRSAVWSWGLRPLDPARAASTGMVAGPATGADTATASWLAHMFLHGDWLHLIGNMVFLVAVGFLVEQTVGGAVLAAAYVGGGIAAAALFVALNPTSAVPLVGASGAIAAFMGLTPVLFGLRRIRFFYFVGVYFDYARAPAVLLLPLWLGYEVVQYALAGDGAGVAYEAHIGGLLAGAAGGVLLRRFTSRVDHGFIEARERDEAVEQGLEEARGYLASLQPERARPIVARLLRERPEDPRVLEACYQTARFDPRSDAYHEAAGRILALGGGGDEVQALVIGVWRDYCRRAKPKVRLRPGLIGPLIGRLIGGGQPDDAESLVRAALANPAAVPDVADRALRLANAFARAGKSDRAEAWYQEVARRFPGSPEAALAAQALEGRVGLGPA